MRKILFVLAAALAAAVLLPAYAVTANTAGGDVDFSFIEGTYLLDGEDGTASFKLDDAGGWESFYASGAHEAGGTVETKEEEDGVSVFILKTDAGKTYGEFVFNNCRWELRYAVGGFDSGYDELCFRLSSEDTALALGLKIGESTLEDVRKALGGSGVDLNTDGSVYDFFDAEDNILKVYFKNGVLSRIAYEGAAAG